MPQSRFTTSLVLAVLAIVPVAACGSPSDEGSQPVADELPAPAGSEGNGGSTTPAAETVTTPLAPRAGDFGATSDAGIGILASPLASAHRYGGVNLSGPELGSVVPGKNFTNFVFPSHALIDYYASKKMNIIRLPFRWLRLQPTASAPLDPTYLALIDDVVTYATGKGLTVLLDVHDYGRFNGGIVGDAVPASVFANLWSQLAGHYKANSKVFFGLMNEPHDQPQDKWLVAVNAAIAAIRKAGAKNLITVPGTSWTGAHSWVSSGNAATMLGVVDSANNYVFEVHQYLDGNSSGTSDTCVSATVGSQRLAAFTAWAKTHGKRAILGEFGGGRNATCYAALDDQLTYMDKNPDVWLGWTYWAGGPWWPASYPFALDPVAGADRPQMATLAKHLTKL
jgi:endoglucanase